MMDPLVEYETEALAFKDRLGFEPGWLIAYLKEKDAIPAEALWINCMIGPVGAVQWSWSAAENPTADDWMRIG